MKKIFLILFVLVEFAPALANASLVSYTGLFYGSSWGQTEAVFPSFDSSLGTLNSISINADLNFTEWWGFTNLTQNQQSFSNAYITGVLDLTGPGADTLGEFIVSLGPMSGIIPAGYGKIAGFYGPSAYYDLSTTIDNSFFVSYLGSSLDTVSFDFEGHLGGSINAPPPQWVPYQFDASIGGSLNITYDYTPTPVPGTFWLLTSGLAGLIGFKRKYLCR
jgi:hypothetical protein